MNDEIRYIIKWRTSREWEKGTVFEWEVATLEDAIKIKKEQESIKENIEVKMFKCEITEIKKEF
ncbi:MAG: hypothetical protein ACRC18_06755 [Cetobacterium sp.]